VLLGQVPLLDLVNASDVYSLGYKLRALGHCIFVDVKSRVLEVGSRTPLRLVLCPPRG
jgi:hypothetical protein